jgi:hypothetical protein
MQMWRSMLSGMMLKSYGSASNLNAPGNAYPLKAYAKEFGIAYQDFAHDVTLANFAQYGLEFAKRYVADLDEADITALRRTADGFALTAADGREYAARHVVLAIGVRHFAYFPTPFDTIPREKVTIRSATARGRVAGRDVWWWRWLVRGRGCRGVVNAGAKA